MKNTIRELLDTVYRYYPRGIPNDDSRYKESDESLRLVAARRQAGANKEPWSALLSRLQHEFPSDSVQTLSLHLPTGAHDGAYAGQIFLPTSPGEHFHTIGFLISFLVPYYVVYSSRIVDDIEKTAALRASQAESVCVFVHDTCFVLPASVVKPEIIAAQEPLQARRQDLSFDFSSDERPYATWIAQDIEATWGYERMPPEVGKVVVPDVATNLRTLGEATLYDCLLSDNW